MRNRIWPGRVPVRDGVRTPRLEGVAILNQLQKDGRVSCYFDKDILHLL
jgi:hypothetical protein